MTTQADIRRRVSLWFISRATAHTVQSVNAHPLDTERLRLWWTKGPGLKRWAESPHPWTALHAALADVFRRHGVVMSPEKLNRLVSAWHVDVFHQHTGSDAYRLAHGGSIRGSKVGPG